MGTSDENKNVGVIGPTNRNPGGIRAGGGNRRALSDINHNIIEGPFAVNKRSLSERNSVCDKKNPPIPPVHRPITRQLTAQLAHQQQHLKHEPEVKFHQQQHLKHEPEAKKQALSIPSSIESEDCTIIDVDEYQTEDVPIFVQHTEAMMEEIDRMDEDEMEEADDEPIVDIDAGDKNNPLAVVEYIDDIYTFYKKAESSGCAPPNYMAQQADINERMRGILIDWLIEVHYKFELMEETLYLTVNLIDRFLALQPLVRKKLQLVGVTAMLLACKYEEVTVPVVEDLILISDKAYTRQEVLDMEKLMVNTLQFNFCVPTPYVFMRRFLKAAQADKKLELLSFFMIELCLVEYEMLKYPPSLLAAAAVYTAQCTLSGYRQWDKTSEWHSSYSEEQLLECSTLMMTFHQKAGTGKLTGVHRKYSTSKYGYAAKTKPANHLIEF